MTTITFDRRTGKVIEIIHTPTAGDLTIADFAEELANYIDARRRENQE